MNLEQCIDYIPKLPMFQHQKDVFLQSRDKEYFALLLEQGTGKSKITIDSGCWLYNSGKIDAIIVIAPCGVHDNWIRNEIPTHLPDYIHYNAAIYRSQMSKDEEKQLCKVLQSENGLKIIAMNVEALVTQKGVSFLKTCLLNYRCLLVVDESSVIKNPKAQRTKNLLKLAIHAKYRRILTGTPVTQGPLDLYTQFSFLDQHILHTSSFYAFRNRYAIMKEMRTAGRSFMNVVGYTNLDELQKLIAPHSYRVTKSECLDLPDKLYTKRYVQLSPNQKTLYHSLKKDIVAEYGGTVMSAPLALTKLLRLQQIVGGYFQPDIELVMNDDMELTGTTKQQPPQAIDTVNPRVESLIELLEETNGKVIIWARFRAEIAAIVCRIKEIWKDSNCVVEYHGGVLNDLRQTAIDLFQNNDTTRFFVGHVRAGGKGLTLHAATTVVYYSNGFSYEDRAQSEDRAHRIGQKHNVTYVDMIAQGTLDEKIVETLRNKKSVADLLTGDDPVAWL